MRDAPQPDSEEIAKPHDELPTSSRWRQITEPPPLLVEQPLPALTPRRMAIAAGVLLCTVSGIVLFLRSGNTQSTSPAERPQSSTVPAVAATKSSFHDSPITSRTTHDTAHQVTPEAATVITADDRKIDEVLRRYTTNPTQDHAVTAQVLINLLPTLTKQGQIEGARHIANLLPDSEYERVMPIWRNARSDRDVIEILGSDLINRDPKLMLPAMLEAVQQPSHPFHERGRQALHLFLDEDYGNDIAKWKEALQRFVVLQAMSARTGGG